MLTRLQRGWLFFKLKEFWPEGPIYDRSKPLSFTTPQEFMFTPYWHSSDCYSPLDFINEKKSFIVYIKVKIAKPTNNLANLHSPQIGTLLTITVDRITKDMQFLNGLKIFKFKRHYDKG